MELKGTIVTYSGFTPSNKNHVTIEVLGMENYFGNAIKSGDEVIIKINGEDKKAPVLLDMETDDLRHALQLIQNAIEDNTEVVRLKEAWNLLSSHIYEIEARDKKVLELETPQELNISQWVINNRYPKGENDKISDFELYNELAEKIRAYASQERNRAIDECIDTLKNDISFSSVEELCVIIQEQLSKLKK